MWACWPLSVPKGSFPSCAISGCSRGWGAGVGGLRTGGPAWPWDATRWAPPDQPLLGRRPEAQAKAKQPSPGLSAVLSRVSDWGQVPGLRSLSTQRASQAVPSKRSCVQGPLLTLPEPGAPPLLQAQPRLPPLGSLPCLPGSQPGCGRADPGGPGQEGSWGSENSGGTQLCLLLRDSLGFGFLGWEPA